LLPQAPRLDRVGSPGFLLALTERERDLVVEAVRMVRREIDREEFHTRLGVDQADADSLIASMSVTPTEAGAQHSSRNPAASSGGVGHAEVVMPMTQADLVLINNALNEALNGLPEEDVAPHLRGTEARSLLNAVGSIFDGTLDGGKTGGAPGHESIEHLR